MGEFEHVRREIRCHEGVVDFPRRNHRAQWLGSVRHLLGDVHEVGRDAKRLSPAVGTGATKAGDDLVKDQKDVVGSADFAQSLQVTVGRNHDPARAGEWLDDHGGNVRRVMQGNDVEQLVGKFGAVLGHAAREVVLLELGVRHVIGFDSLPEQLAIGADAADRNAPEVDTVVALFPADQPGLAGLTLGAPVGTRHLQRSVNRFRARTGEEDMFQAGWHQGLDLVGQLEGQWMGVLKRRTVVKFCDLPAHGFGDFAAAVAQAAAPQT